MRIYEELYILRPDTSEEVIEASVDLIRQIVTGAGGVIDKVDKWGLRKLAYRVAKQSEGFYVLVQFSCGPEVVKEIERRLRVNDAVFKYITVRIDEKLKLIEKKKKLREKRAARKPPPAPPATAPTPAAPAPGLPSAPMPAAPMPAAPMPAAQAPAAPAAAAPAPAPAVATPAAEAEPAPATPEPAEK